MAILFFFSSDTAKPAKMLLAARTGRQPQSLSPRSLCLPLMGYARIASSPLLRTCVRKSNLFPSLRFKRLL